MDKTDNEDTTTEDYVEVMKIPTSTEPSGMSTITIVFIICGVVVLWVFLDNIYPVYLNNFSEFLEALLLFDLYFVSKRG